MSICEFPLACLSKVIEEPCVLTQQACVVLSQLVCRRVGGVQPELWRRGADAAGPVRPENQPDQRRRPGWLSLRPAHPDQEAGLQLTQLSAGLDRWAVVTGKHVWKWSRVTAFPGVLTRVFMEAQFCQCDKKKKDLVNDYKEKLSCNNLISGNK